jgi:hypothetical protein
MRMDRSLIFRVVVFQTAAFFLLLSLCLVLHSRIGRVLFSIGIVLVCLAAELFVVYKIGRQLWEFSGRATELLLSPEPSSHSPELLTRSKN